MKPQISSVKYPMYVTERTSESLDGIVVICNGIRFIDTGSTVNVSIFISFNLYPLLKFWNSLCRTLRTQMQEKMVKQCSHK